MNNHLEILLKTLDEARAVPITRLCFADTPMGQYYPHPRLMITLSGKKHIRFRYHGVEKEEYLVPGEAIVSLRGIYTPEIWDSPHRMLGMVFMRDYIRILCIDHNGDRKYPPNGANYFYHTRQNFDLAGKYILYALLNKNSDCKAMRLAVAALLEMVLTILKEESTGIMNDEDREWERARTVLLHHFTKNLGREEFAELAEVSPARFSLLLKQYTGFSFREYINELRMEHAMALLTETSLTVEEIGTRCGFNYPSYFIRIFKEKSGITPANYRLKNNPFLPSQEN